MRAERVAFAALVASVGTMACGSSTIVAGHGRIGSAERVVAAMDNAASIAGHPIELEIDSTITEGRTRDEAQQIVAAGAKELAEDLLDLRQEDPAVFAREVPRVARVVCHYGDGGAQPVRWDGTTLVLTRNYRWQVLAHGDVADALRDDFHAALARRFSGVEPEQVIQADRRDYFLFLVYDAPRHDGAFAGPPPPGPTLTRVLRLAAVAGGADPRLATDLRAWLLGCARSIADADPATVQAPEALRARAAWVQWLGATLPSASASEKLDVANAVFADREGGTSGPPGVVGVTLEGFDLFGFGLSIADAWIAAGHPSEHLDDPDHLLWQRVLDPPQLEAHGAMPRFNYGGSPWLRAAFALDPQGKRLADALASRNDVALLGEVIYNLPRGDSGRDTRANLLQQLERTPVVWRRVMGILIGQGLAYEGCDSGLVDEANRVWRDAPALRGTALLVIACSEGVARGISDAYFAQFAKLYGAPVGAALFASFLDGGPDAMRLADALWPAMSPGWSRAAAISSHLGAFLADPRVRAGEDEEPMHTLGALARRLCEDGPAEVTRLHDALAERAKADVAEGRALAKVLDDTAPGRCAPPAEPPPARSGKRRVR
jgi:hypothetical protein